jgi:hypothetical protein
LEKTTASSGEIECGLWRLDFYRAATLLLAHLNQVSPVDGGLLEAECKNT